MDGVDRLIDKLSEVDASGGLAGFDLIYPLAEFFKRSDVQERLIKLNTDRLYYRSLDNKGALMPPYSESTLKRKKGRGVNATKRYTYYDTGDTYENLEVVIYQGESVGIYPDHESAPDYAHLLLERAWGLTEEDLAEIRPEMVEHLVTELKNYLNE